MANPFAGNMTNLPGNPGKIGVGHGANKWMLPQKPLKSNRLLTRVASAGTDAGAPTRVVSAGTDYRWTDSDKFLTLLTLLTRVASAGTDASGGHLAAVRCRLLA